MIKMSDELHQELNRQVANWTVLYEKFHHYHWYIKGKHFFTLHEKFEELYNEANQYIDDLAERILALGGKPVATLSECLKITTLQEASGNENEDTMVNSVIQDLEKLTTELTSGIELAEKEHDDGTADMFIGICQNLKKHIWMLKSFLG
jgi:starvation-inducible DNA-binding protein